MASTHRGLASGTPSNAWHSTLRCLAVHIRLCSRRPAATAAFGCSTSLPTCVRTAVFLAHLRVTVFVPAADSFFVAGARCSEPNSAGRPRRVQQLRKARVRVHCPGRRREGVGPAAVEQCATGATIGWRTAECRRLFQYCVWPRKLMPHNEPVPV